MPARLKAITANHLVAWALAFSISAFSWADTITVAPDGSADHKTIQAAIDAADVGDTVTVAAGYYRENITVKSGVTIIGAGPADTIIDGGATGSAVTANNVDPNTTLEALGITNGFADNGGGILCINSSPTIANCSIWKNKASGSGAGIYNSGSSPTITECTFSANSALGQDAAGGGICNTNRSGPMLTECTFSSNTAMNGSGGAIANSIASSPTLTRITFSANKAVNGGAIHNESDSNPDMTHLTFSANFAASHGGAVHSLNSNPTLTTCVFSANRAAEGPALYTNNSTLRISDCTFSANVTSTSPEHLIVTCAVEAAFWLVLGMISISSIIRSTYPHRVLFALAASLTVLLLALLELYEAIGPTWQTSGWLFWPKAIFAAILLLLLIACKDTNKARTVS